MSLGPCPQVGSVVHFIDQSAAHRAALVIHVLGDDCRKVWIRVFCTAKQDYEASWIDQGDERGTWHWPEGTQ